MESKPPRSLAENLSAGGSCPIPATHDRLEECHYWWHEMGRNYHEPGPFRYSLGAFLQAARSVTFMLQAERRAFKDLVWYEAWADRAKESPTLSWVNKSRVSVVHEGALATNSWMELRCLNDDGSIAESTARRVNPFICTHRSMEESSAVIGPAGEDHGHDFVRYWELDELAGRELLEACSEVYQSLSDLVDMAHREAGATVRPNYAGPIPCMQETLSHRTAHITKTGEWLNPPPGLHEH